MKFKNFNVEDVLGCNDCVQGTKLINREGYFANDLETLDKLDCLDRLVYITTIRSKNPFMFQCGQGMVYKYFLPLNKVKKEYTCDFNTAPLDNVKYRACKDIREVMELLDKNKHGSNLVGTIIHIRHKTTMTIETSMITNVKRYSNGKYSLGLGNMYYSLRDLFDCYCISINGKYQPFGVKDEQ